MAVGWPPDGLSAEASFHARRMYRLLGGCAVRRRRKTRRLTDDDRGAGKQHVTHECQHLRLRHPPPPGVHAERGSAGHSVCGKEGCPMSDAKASSEVLPGPAAGPVVTCAFAVAAYRGEPTRMVRAPQA